MPRKYKEPTYCLHTPSGQAYVRLNGKMHYLGIYNSAESQAAYHREIHEWNQRGRLSEISKNSPVLVTIDELVLRYWKLPAVAVTLPHANHHPIVQR